MNEQVETENPYSIPPHTNEVKMDETLEALHLAYAFIVNGPEGSETTKEEVLKEVRLALIHAGSDIGWTEDEVLHGRSEE